MVLIYRQILTLSNMFVINQALQELHNVKDDIDSTLYCDKVMAILTKCCIKEGL